MRLLSPRAFSGVLGASSGGGAFAARRTSDGGAGLPIYLAPEKLKPFIDDDLAASLNPPYYVASLQDSRLPTTRRFTSGAFLGSG